MTKENPNSMLPAGLPTGSSIFCDTLQKPRATKQIGWTGRILSLFVLILIMVHFLPARSFAEGQGPKADAPQDQGQKQRRTSVLDEKVSQFAKNLDLTETQKSEVRKILEEQQQEILRIRRDPSLTGSAGIDRVRALQKITVDKIRAVLNEEQKKKYDPLAPRRLPPPAQPNVEDWLNVTEKH